MLSLTGEVVSLCYILKKIVHLVFKEVPSRPVKFASHFKQAFAGERAAAVQDREGRVLRQAAAHRVGDDGAGMHFSAVAKIDVVVIRIDSLSNFK